jgi:hypothetical protein
LTNLWKNKKVKKAQITNIRTETENITIDTTDIKRLITEYYKQLAPTNLTTQMKWTNSLKNTNYYTFDIN